MWGGPPGWPPEVEKAPAQLALIFVTFYRRRLPHLFCDDQPVFLTWRLHGSLPPNRWFPSGETSGRAFVAIDRLLEQTRTGPFYLRQPAIANMVVEVLLHHADVLGRYELHAFAVMPNHVHLLIAPLMPVPQITKRLKTYTARLANVMLARTGSSFWQDESYDHLVRNRDEWHRIKRYIELNPVRAGLAKEPERYLWSSAGWATWRSPADQRSAPPDQRSAPHDQRSAPHDQRSAPHDQRSAPHDQRSAPHDQRSAPRDQRSASQEN